MSGSPGARADRALCPAARSEPWHGRDRQQRDRSPASSGCRGTTRRPTPYLVESARRAGSDGPRPPLGPGPGRWSVRSAGSSSSVARGRAGAPDERQGGQPAPASSRFARAPEDVLVIYELGLVGLYAGLSKVLRRDQGGLPGRGGLPPHRPDRHRRLKVARPPARGAASSTCSWPTTSPPGTTWSDTLKVPDRQDRRRLVAGRPAAGPGAAPPPGCGPGPRGGAAVRQRRPPHPAQGRRPADPRRVAAYRREFGPCVLWVIGDGPERDALVELTRRLHVEESVTFLGTVDHQPSRAPSRPVRRSCSRRSRTSSAASSVEALTTGAPVVVSPMTGAVGTIVQDGVNGIVVDPHDAPALAEAMHRATDPQTSRALREGVQRMNPPLLPDAAAEVVLRAVALARGPPPPAAGRSRPRWHTSHRDTPSQKPPCPPCRIGEVVEVRSPRRSWPRSTRTASSTGCRSCPRCSVWCGQRLRVDKLALKLCDTIDWTGMYRMRDAVHLDGSRCDGQAHGGCQAGCNIYWKEAWLKRVPAGDRPTAARPRGRRRCPLHAGDADSGDAPARGPRRPGRGAVRVPGDRAAAGRARAHPVVGRQAVRPGRPLGQRRRAGHDPHGRRRPVQRVPGRQPAPAAPAAADPGRPPVPVHRGPPPEDAGAHARPAARRAGSGQAQGGDRRDARRQQRQPRHDVRRGDAALLRAGGPGAAPGRADHRREDRPDAAASRTRASSWTT